MKAVVMKATGGPDVLETQEMPTYEITADDQVLVRLKAAGVNPVDIKLREGSYPVSNLPTILGWDCAGVVEAVGPAVTAVKPGDEVYAMYGSFGNPEAQGTYADYALMHERNVAPKPALLSFAEAAAVPLVLLTAWEALLDRARLQAGQTVLIQAGAGGVGHLAVQLAANAGATVYTTVGSPKKAAWVKKLGATEAILYKETDVVAAVMDLTGGQGVDVGLDILGGPLFEATIPAVKHYGDLVTLLIPPPGVNLAPARMRNLRLGFEIVLAPLVQGLTEHQARQRDILTEAAALFDRGALKTHVSRTFPLEEVSAAHEAIAEGSTTGKIVLLI